MACCTRCTNVKWSGVSGQWSLATTHGFTLAETLIASVVLAVSVVAVSGAIIASQQQTTVSQEDMIAISLAPDLSLAGVFEVPQVAAMALGGAV